MTDRHPQPGAVLLGKYVVESVMGVGGMGAVIKARHRELDEPVAIKCLLPEMQRSPDVVARFLREAKSAVKLKNEHVAHIHDVGRLEDQTPYIVMEYLAGGDLSAYLESHAPLPIGTAIDLVLQACEGFAEAHSIGVIHRDIKLSNFALANTDEPPLLKVLDFGIATAPAGGGDLTTTDSVLGTPSYMAPEQMRSMKVADERSDIWSLGVVAYELIENARPFRGEVYAALCLSVAMDPPVPMVRAEPALAAAILKCLEKEPAHRYQTMAQLAAALVPFAVDRARAQTMADECSRLERRTPTRRSAPEVPSRVAPTVKDSPKARELTVTKGKQIATSARWLIAIVGVLAIAGGLSLVLMRLWSPQGIETPIEKPIKPIEKPIEKLVEKPPVDGKAMLSAVRASLWEGDGKALELSKAAVEQLTGPAQLEAKMLYGDALYEDGRYRRAKKTYADLLEQADGELRSQLEERIKETEKALKRRPDVE